MALLLRILKRLGFIILALLVLYAVGRPTQIWLDGFYSGVREPYLQMMSSNAVTLRWQSENKFVGVVRYGITPGQLDKIQRETVSGEEHEIRLTDLKPATKYFYSVGDENKESFKGQNFWFKTAPEIKADSDNHVRFWVTGDQGYANIIQEQVRDSMLSWIKKNPRSSLDLSPIDFWLTTGDNAYRSGSNDQFQAGFFEPYKSILRNTPVWPIYGNHDARRWVFFDIFTFPTKAESGGVASASEHYYSFDYANIHFVILDTEGSDLDVDGKMLSWLKKDLKETKQQWLIAFSHHPPYTKGSHNSDNKRDSRGRLFTVRENILPLLEEAGVDLVFSGHSHMYERSELINCHYDVSSTFANSMIREQSKDNKYKKKENNISANSGTIYTVIGSSSKVDNGPLDHPAMPHSLQEAGSMIFDVKQKQLKAYFINKSGQIKDQFEIMKGVEGGVESRSCF
ncbi:MAG: metallophosphoesterase family protein [Gammaproteobacteria bacterium]|nr:metallophosphoesterase family protein [Gammaproteobacteria bacterium]